MAEAGIEPSHMVRDTTQSLATQLADVLDTVQETARLAGAQSWLWFLTEDTVVAHDALAKQLQAVEVSPSVAIAGAKQLADQRRLVDVGLTVAHSGEVLSMIEPGELDQGQYDHRTDVCQDRKSTRLNSSHVAISYAVFCLKKKTPDSTT